MRQRHPKCAQCGYEASVTNKESHSGKDADTGARAKRDTK